MAADGDPAVQMVLPMAEMVGWLRKGVGELIRQAGLQLMDLLMQEEVRELVGERSQPQAERTANRWGSEGGYCVVMGQKVPIQRPRVRTTDDKEVRLGSYEMFHRGLNLRFQRKRLRIKQFDAMRALQWGAAVN
jgi:putative transposase